MAARLSFWTDSLTRSYSKIFFADSRLFGLAIIASTFVVPMHGLFGLAAALISNGTAMLIGLDRRGIRQGLYGFNGVLTGLGIGFFFQWSFQSLALLVVASILVLFVRIVLDNALGYYLGLPVMSLPFTLVTWLLLLASIEFGYLGIPFERLLFFNRILAGIPAWGNCFFCNIGAVLFQVNSLSGLVIAAGLLLYSPLALLLIIVGFMAGGGLQSFFGVDLVYIKGQFLGFNYMLTALALGGIFARPGPGSLLAAVLGVCFAVVILTGLVNFLPANLTPLAMPFNLAVLLVLYVFKSRAYPTLGVALLPAAEISTPEGNLAGRRQAGPALGLPFHGGWQVSQGVDGQYTHQEDWRFAYDFMAIDEQGAYCRSNGAKTEDYYSFGLPVLAPAAGRVAGVIDHIEDNPIGRLNLAENWGNYVIIEHQPGLYACLAHLKKESIGVTAGQMVKKGQPLGQCGNSGRSPYPHLHMQLQMHAFAGAASIPFKFANLLIDGDGGCEFLHRGMLRETQVVRNLPATGRTEEFFPYSPAQEHVYDLNGKTEVWQLKADLAGQFYLETFPEKSRADFERDGGLIRFTAFSGSRQTGLYFLVKYFRELPLASDATMTWTANEELEPVITPLQRLAFLFALLGLRPVRRISYEMRADHRAIRLEAKAAVGLTFCRWAIAFPGGAAGPVRLLLEEGRGVQRLTRNDSCLELKEVRPVIHHLHS